ncbi:YceI family protein [Phycisphaera mikurensis]|uniref:Lipid/polyisoprenoid-binding YceI-like domain-containing protein n=1 Tax=Phycisphaera mikurensis (strain NBRC 102666 / KCTC 22515 / FYK2301M01) TaxID=1142394 RepID=I0IFI6_PHYMF|nr:YceI family protein [Phycisphaera mikurensis]MBB6440584.1 polyisoprenoid-binding protein YceI [Phycisphaera mikurensis]BAM04024.1 hypothetical protein PSMK_18650 [Phycisphaera mikurensis NBRC 102666]
MPRLLTALLAALLCLPASAERLLVFVRSGASPLQAAFREDHLPKIRSLAGDLGVPVELIDLAETGEAPAEVKITPLLVFQDWRGRSVYQGRYATPDRITNFLRTARAMPQGDAPLVREALPVQAAGRATIAVPLKITPLSGPGAGRVAAPPDARAFVAAVEGFALADRVELGRADRLWYANFYPYAGERGYAVSAELYSQFHCHEPVWTNFESPARSDGLGAAFASAARALTEELREQLAASPRGDGFDAVPAGFPVAAWDAMGLGLPERPAGTPAADAAGVELATAWEVVVDPAAGPAVTFAFPAPLDGYAGEAAGVSGALALDSVDDLAGMTGRIAADPASVTMGEDDLDAWIHGGVLEVDEHPESSFVIESVDAPDGSGIAFGRPTPLTLHGTFTMKGIQLPLAVPVQLEAFVAEDGRPRLRMDGAWTLPIAEPFRIDGPPGDEEAASKLRFACRLVFAPAPG